MHKLPVTAAILEHELSQVRLLLERETGVLLDTPNETLSDALLELIEKSHATSAANYIEALRASEAEREKLAESLMLGETRFFRYPLGFQALTKLVLPELELRKRSESPKVVRVWSAGCSTGQEPYSIAISLCEALKSGKGEWTLRIIGSDIRAGAIEQAERGLYSEADLQNLPSEIVQTYFARIGQHFLVKPRLRNLVTFTRANLTKPNYLGRYDCIFCMDVLSHFSSTQKVALVEKLHLYLEPGGFLFLGQGEKLPAASNAGFRWENYSDYTVYQRPLASGAACGE
jgi:chemotaxis methyl-accepting protein methylase